MKLVIDQGLLIEKVGSETAVTHRNGDICVLNESAGLLLDCFETACSVEAAACRLTERYGIDFGAAYRDCVELVGRLLSEGVLIDASDTQTRLSATGCSRRELLNSLANLSKRLWNSQEGARDVGRYLADAVVGEAGLGSWMSKESGTSARVWRDSLGNETVLPGRLNTVAPFGAYSQALLESVCPEKLVYAGGGGLHASAAATSAPAAMRMNTIYSRRRNRSLIETVKADLVLEIATTFQMLAAPRALRRSAGGASVIRLVTGFGNVPQTYRTVGNLLADDRANALAEFVEDLLMLAESNKNSSRSCNRPRVFYGLGRGGLDTLGRGTLFSRVVEDAGGVNAAGELSKEQCGRLSLHQIMEMKPDVVVLASSRKDVLDVWSAWDTCSVHFIPTYPYPWLGGNPLAMQTLGLLWLNAVLFPGGNVYDITEVVRSCFMAFFRQRISLEKAELIVSMDDHRESSQPERLHDSTWL